MSFSETLVPTGTWTEQVGAIAPRAVLTEQARYEVFRRIGQQGRSVAEVARAFGVAWGTAWAAFEAHARPAVEDPDRIGGVQALGVDETGFLAATHTHPRIFATGLVDLRRGLLCPHARSEFVFGGRGRLRRATPREPRWSAGTQPREQSRGAPFSTIALGFRV